MVSIAECMMQLAGEYHIFVARYGGDEFMMLDYGTELLEPVRVMERLHFLIAKKCEEKKIREQVLYSWGIPWGEDLVSFYHNLTLRFVFNQGVPCCLTIW